MQLDPSKISHKVKTGSTTLWNEFHFVMMNKIVNFALRPDNLPITTSVPGFHTPMVALQSNVTAIATLKAATINPITGFAQQKTFAKASLITISVDIMNTVFGYAYSVSNDILKQQSKISASELENVAYSKMLSRTQAGIDSITPYATDGSLSPYNITPATIAAWQAIKDQASVTLTNPEGAIAHRESLNLNIQTLMHESMISITNILDTVIYQFRATNLNYFNEYFASRHLNEHHVPTQLRMSVTDLLGQPVIHGEVFILGTPSSGILDLEGYCFVDHIPHGIHEVRLTTPSGEFTYGPFEFKMGKSKTLNVTIDTATNAKTSKISVTEEETAVPIEK